MLANFLINCFKYSVAGMSICLYATFAGWEEGELLRYLKALWKTVANDLKHGEEDELGAIPV